MGSCSAGGNDADARIVMLDVHDKEQARCRVKANHSIAFFVVTPRVHQTKQWIEKYRGSLLERHPVVFAWIAGGNWRS